MTQIWVVGLQRESPKVIKNYCIVFSEWSTQQDLSRYEGPVNASICHCTIEYKVMFRLLASGHLCTGSEVYVEPIEIKGWSCKLNCLQINHLVQQHRMVCLLSQQKQRLTKAHLQACQKHRAGSASSVRKHVDHGWGRMCGQHLLLANYALCRDTTEDTGSDC